MSKKQQVLSAISSAVYGEEVRGAIHDGIEECYDNVENKIVSSNTAPTSPNAQIWIDTSQQTTDSMPQIDDANVSSSDTWSSQKITDEIGQLSEEIDEKFEYAVGKENQLDRSINSPWQIRKLNSKQYAPYTLPFDLPIDIITDGNKYLYNFDITAYKNPENAVYYVAPNGAAANDGTREHPKRLQDFLVHGALIDSDNVTGILLDGIYRDLGSAQRQTAFRNINLIAEHPGKAIVANAADVLTYSQDSTYTKCYTATRSNVLKVVQLYDSDYLMLAKAASESDCNATPGSWYLDGSNKLYVHLFFDIVPEFSNTVVLLNYNRPAFEITNQYQNTSVYLEGITFMGGNPATLRVKNSSTYTDAKIFAKDCKFIGAWDRALEYDAVSILGATAFFVNCEASFSSKDGFNYHKSNNVIPKFIEIGCVGSNNGIDGYAARADSPWQNGSTSHDGAYGVRINGTYFNNYGANVADVQANTTTVNINCKAFDSAYKGNNASANCDFCAQQAGATMYLEGCVGFGSLKSCRCVADTTIHVHNCDFETAPEGEGTIINE